MYFKNRKAAGVKLAERLAKYRDDTAVIMALSEGGVVVGRTMADKLNLPLTMLLSRDINLPNDTSVLGTVDQTGGFVYNSMFSVGQLEEYVTEYHNYMETEKIHRVSELNHILARHGLTDRHAFKDHVVILVSDGVKNGAAFDSAINYLKPIRLKRLVVASPVASIEAIDRMHIIADELHVVGVTPEYLETDHYYDDNKLPESNKILEKLDDWGGDQPVADKPKRTYT
ncbi:MAG TPA: hypothetical protein VF996_02530 [Candidatus Saccharimonadales bacterium]|jgi:predicted phosphoribosyltransferase